MNHVRSIAVLLALAMLTGCTRAPENPPASGEDTTAAAPPDQPVGHGEPTPSDGVSVVYAGYGSVRAGMTVTEAEQALGARLVSLGPDTESCRYVTIEGRPGVALMVIEGRIARADVEGQSSIKTAEGAGIGDTEEQIRALYPGFIEVQPHKYVDGRYLIVRAPADTNLRIIFETDGTRVTSFRAGRMPEVRWVEGCS